MDYGVLARSYNTLFYINELRELLSTFFDDPKYLSFTKPELHKRINNVLLKNYDGEEILKYKLANSFRNKKYVAAFEVKVNESRADFLVINGYTKCYEVKSKIDTLRRLPKQIKDYGDVFEYNTVVIDKKHLNLIQEMLPLHYGIWFYEGLSRIEYRKPLLSPMLNPQSQLQLLTKKELVKYFKFENIQLILENYNSSQINIKLKEALKDRYIKRWQFVKDNWSGILPIDVQFFFNTNINPDLIYK